MSGSRKELHTSETKKHLLWLTKAYQENPEAFARSSKVIGTTIPEPQDVKFKCAACTMIVNPSATHCPRCNRCLYGWGKDGTQT